MNNKNTNNENKLRLIVEMRILLKYDWIYLKYR
jgi:hypothetical protein